MKRIIFTILVALPFVGFAQSYTSSRIGSLTDIETNPSGGICLMGGATEDDNAIKWFLQRANGGDVLVLRTTGSDGYNSYFYSDLGIVVNSVETIVCNDATASSDPYVIQRIQQAEAIWFAGGDQWSYVSYWRNSQVDNAINQSIVERNLVIGGTSAGMAIQGKYYFSAQNGTVTSSEALANPFNNLVSVDSAAFVKNAYLDNAITEMHFDNPDRKGRVVTFLARIKADYGVYAKAIACDEYTAVCIDTSGIARVFGGYPNYEDNAYFIQSNCGLTVQEAENCNAGIPLTWNLGGLAIQTYQIKGDSTGSKTFDLNNWQTGTGGTWNSWSVSNGVFSEQTSAALSCSILAVNEHVSDLEMTVYPNPTSDKLTIAINDSNFLDDVFCVYNNLGRKIDIPSTFEANKMTADLSNLPNGMYFLVITSQGGKIYREKIVKK